MKVSKVVNTTENDGIVTVTTLNFSSTRTQRQTFEVCNRYKIIEDTMYILISIKYFTFKFHKVRESWWTPWKVKHFTEEFLEEENEFWVSEYQLFFETISEYKCSNNGEKQ